MSAYVCALEFVIGYGSSRAINLVFVKQVSRALNTPIRPGWLGIKSQKSTCFDLVSSVLQVLHSARGYTGHGD